MAHPLRGALFETWMVSEVLKHRTNRGATGGLAFYRDRAGVELDLVVDDADRLTLVEAKSGATPSSSMFDTAKRVRTYLDGLRAGSQLAVVYGGNEFRRQSDGSLLIPWRQARDAAGASS